MKGFNKACSITYELALIFTLLVALLAPIHAHSTRHFTVTEKIDETRATIQGDTTGIEPGALLKLYRFNPSWKLALGTARVEEVRKDSALISYNPETLAWPIGTPDEYAYRTQAVFFQNNALIAAEILLPILVLLLYTYAYTHFKQSPLRILGTHITASARVHAIKLFWICNMLFGIPFVWFISKMPLYLLSYLFFRATQYFTGQPIDTRTLADALLPYVYLMVGGIYCAYLIIKRKSPILAFWRFISYKGVGVITRVSWQRGIVLWTLHLVIAYVFAYTLIGFLRGNIAAARAIGWPAPDIDSAFEFWKFIIWSLTIVGCLIGYGYSLLSILWGKYIRNLDFTVAGWLTNGFCYPLFGIVIWQMIPSFTGPDPIITDGPLLWCMLILGLVLNVLYMLTIWNLGTMFGVMTDKGVRTWGFYSVVRHPSYTLEVLMFFVTELVGLTSGVHWLAITMYFFIYWIRSEREDNFMLYSNPAFEPYIRETPYKFIPGIY